jgi:HEAT repeat protein
VVFLAPPSRCAQRAPALLVLLTLLFAVAVASPLHAAEHVGELIQQLRTNKDFRVRTQAALALGVSGSKQAVGALCSGLADANSTVRAASAAALGKLRLGGRECLQERLQVEQHETVKQMLAKVLRTLAPGSGKAIGPDTRYYLAIGDTTNKTARPDGDIDAVVRGALDQVMATNNLLAMAPVGETAEQAQKLLALHKQVKSVFIWPKVQASDEGPNLILRMSFALFSYPDKAFKGSMERKLTMPGAKSSDAKAIEELIGMAVEKFMERLAPAVDQFE